MVSKAHLFKMTFSNRFNQSQLICKRCSINLFSFQNIQQETNPAVKWTFWNPDKKLWPWRLFDQLEPITSFFPFEENKSFWLPMMKSWNKNILRGWYSKSIRKLWNPTFFGFILAISKWVQSTIKLLLHCSLSLHAAQSFQLTQQHWKKTS